MADIATEKFKLTFENGNEKEAVLILSESGAFAYGNQTCMELQIDGEFQDSFDTRYEVGCNSPESFHEWSLKFMRSYIRKTTKVERS